MDEKAKKILFSSYWDNGWIDSDYPAVSAEVFEYAKAKGLMFEPFSISHDDCIKAIVKLVEELSEVEVAKGFLSSLTSRRLDWRSSISSYAIAKNLKVHRFSPEDIGTTDIDGRPGAQSLNCNTCRCYHSGIFSYDSYSDEDLNVLNFERIKWGGVRHGDLLYTLFDLEKVKDEVVPEPTEDDVTCFMEILKTIESSEPTDYPRTLEKRLAPVIKSNKEERKVLLEILASIGVLKPADYDRPTRTKSDWFFVEQWRGEDKYSLEAVSKYFSHYL